LKCIAIVGIVSKMYLSGIEVARSTEVRGRGRTPYVDIADRDARHDCGGVVYWGERCAVEMKVCGRWLKS
jgi:hypothetical protein